MSMGIHDVAIIGAGPVGIACGVACRQQGLDAIAVDRGCVTAALYDYPTHMTFFSTAERLEIGGYPFPSVHAKPTKQEALQYYRSVAKAAGLELRLYTTVSTLTGHAGDFTLHTNREPIRARRVIIATGFFSRPVTLDVPGEDTPKVSHYFIDGHRYAETNLAIVGGANSAVIAALECWRMGARVTMIVRDHDFYQGVKYWLLPDIKNRIAEGSITAYFATQITAIHPTQIELRNDESTWSIPNDFVLAMTGYRADHDWVTSLGVELNAMHVPKVDARFESQSQPGVHVAGCALCGDKTNDIFIENGRHHAEVIARHLRAELT